MFVASWVVNLFFSVALLIVAGVPPAYFTKEKDRTIYVCVVTPCLLIIYLLSYFLFIKRPIERITQHLEDNPYTEEEREVELRNIMSGGGHRGRGGYRQSPSHDEPNHYRNNHNDGDLEVSNTMNHSNINVNASNTSNFIDKGSRATRESTIGGGGGAHPVASSRQYCVPFKEVVHLEETVIQLERARGAVETHIINIRRQMQEGENNSHTNLL